MKFKICALLMVCVAAAAAADKPAAKKPKPAPANKVQDLTIPAGAIEVEPYTYSYTDPQGKKWIYRKTPFGISRAEDTPVAVDDARDLKKDENARLVNTTTAVEQGGLILFERPGPFGLTKWQRKKTELNEVERAVWDRELQKRAAGENPASAAKDKD
jgi:hypothetical protein